MSKEDGSFAVAGKFLKKYMLICLQKYPFLPFYIPKFDLKSLIPPFHFEDLSPPFGFPHPKLFFRFPPFWIFQNVGSPPLLKGGDTLWLCSRGILLLFIGNSITILLLCTITTTNIFMWQRKASNFAGNRCHWHHCWKLKWYHVFHMSQWCMILLSLLVNLLLHCSIWICYIVISKSFTISQCENTGWS